MPEYLDEIPRDVIDGNPLRYQVKPDGGYVVYSIGWNQTDDGGAVAIKKVVDGNPIVDRKTGDWVWEIPRPAAP